MSGRPAGVSAKLSDCGKILLWRLPQFPKAWLKNCDQRSRRWLKRDESGRKYAPTRTSAVQRFRVRSLVPRLPAAQLSVSGSEAPPAGRDLQKITSTS